MTTTNTLVSLEEARKYVRICLSWDLTFLNPHAVVSGMDKIPTINPLDTILAEIDKMIEEERNRDTMISIYRCWGLKELKSRLSLTK